MMSQVSGAARADPRHEPSAARVRPAIDQDFPAQRFGAVYAEVPRRLLLPTRLMAGRAILKYMRDLSDEALCDRWIETHIYGCSAAKRFSGAS